MPLYCCDPRHFRSPGQAHQEAIARVILASMVFVAEDGGDIVGVLRGRKDRLQSLFVREDHHRQGIGRRLVERFEQECARQGGSIVRVAATPYAIPLYTDWPDRCSNPEADNEAPRQETDVQLSLLFDKGRHCEWANGTELTGLAARRMSHQQSA